MAGFNGGSYEDRGSQFGRELDYIRPESEGGGKDFPICVPFSGETE